MLVDVIGQAEMSAIRLPDASEADIVAMRKRHRGVDRDLVAVDAERITGKTRRVVRMMWATINVAIPQANAGKVRGLAIAEPRRLARMKDMPTVAEALPDYEVSAWYAVFAPGGTSAPVVEQLSAELQRIYRERDVIERLAPLGYEPAVMGPAPLAAALANDLKKWEKVVRDAGIKPE